MRIRDYVSDTVICHTGIPQRRVLAPFLCTLYTADFSHQSPHSHLQEFSEDSDIIGLIRDGDDRAYRGLIKDFLDWCQQNHLQLSAGKTKELVVDFSRHKKPYTQLNVQGTDIEMLTSYKYLRVHLNKRLDLTYHTAATYKKGQSRLHLLRKLFSMEKSAGAAASQQQVGRDWIKPILGSS